MQSTKERLLAAVARYAKGKEGRLYGREFCRVAGVSHTLVQTHFKGFAGLLRAAKLGGRRHRIMGISEGALLAEYDRLAGRLKRHPKWTEVERDGRFSPSVYFRRFGRTRGVRERYERWR